MITPKSSRDKLNQDSMGVCRISMRYTDFPVRVAAARTAAKSLHLTLFIGSFERFQPSCSLRCHKVYHFFIVRGRLAPFGDRPCSLSYDKTPANPRLGYEQVTPTFLSCYTRDGCESRRPAQ